MDRIAVIARFRREQAAQVKALLEAGPPYDPADADIERHTVYLSGREAVFAFEGPDVASEVEDLVDDFLRPELQAALAEWRELLDEEPRIARPVFVWERGAVAAAPASAPDRVVELMDGAFAAIAPDGTLGEAVELMSSRGSPALVVDYGRLIGVLDAADVLRAVAERVHPSDARAREWMREPPATVAPDATVDEAAGLMVEHGLHHLPVVEGERAVGLVSLRALVAAGRDSSA